MTQNILKMDSFGHQVPQLNLKGDTRVSTLFGGLLTCAVWVTMLAYSSLKLAILIGRRNPQIVEATEKNYFSVNSALSIDETNFRIAFAFLNDNTDE